jgi:DNA repair exonuclease SbcCD ATPase subunit
MIPVKLSVNGIYDSDAVYSFGNAKDVYPINEAEKIKQCIGYAVFGNDTLYRGSISFEFVYGGKNYIVSRNFEKNTVALTVNGTLMPEQAETEKILRETMLLTPGQWSEIAIASKHEAYDSAVKDVKKFSENFYSTLDIDTDTVENSVAQYRDEISAVGNKAEALKKLMPNTDGLEERRKNLGDEIASMKADAAKLSRLVGIGEFNKATAEKLAAVNEKLACEEAKATKIETDGKRLEKSKAIKEHFAFMKEAAGAEADAAAVKEQIETKSGDAARLASEIAAGGKVVAKKQRAYIDSAERIKALGAALDEEIGENLASGKNEEYILGKAGEYCAEGAKTLEELKKIEEETLAEKKKTDEALAAVKDEFDSVRVNAEYRKGVREGACFETLITARKAQSECVAEAIGKENVSLEFLQKQLAENEETVAQCKLKYAQIFGNGDEEKTVKTLISEFNELERIKQGIYRNQIISASLLQEIDAIDKKIGENTEMKRSCEENSRSLENAKRTLILYTEKCSDRLSEISETLIEAKSVLKLSDDVDRLEYGGICPVCSGLVADKADRSAETETARKKADEAEAEKNASYGNSRRI